MATETYDERVRQEAEAIRAGGGPPIQHIKHVEGECYICDALRLVEAEEEADDGD